MNQAAIEAAELLIETEDAVAFEVAAEHGQNFEAVKETTWFLNTLAEQLESPEAASGILFEEPTKEDFESV